MPGYDGARGAKAWHQIDLSAVRGPYIVKADRTRLKQVLINLLLTLSNTISRRAVAVDITAAP